jgi:hypothetical protein
VHSNDRKPNLNFVHCTQLFTASSRFYKTTDLKLERPAWPDSQSAQLSPACLLQQVDSRSGDCNFANVLSMGSTHGISNTAYYITDLSVTIHIPGARISAFSCYARPCIPKPSSWYIISACWIVVGTFYQSYITPCSPLKVSRRFGGAYSLRLQGRISPAR